MKQSHPLTPEEWRDYHRRVYLKELRRRNVRIVSGWQLETVDPPVDEAADLLLTASLNTRKVKCNAHL
jgi:hypothetical protein